MRLLAQLAAIIILACSAQAQESPEPSTYPGTPPAELILQWLQSPDPRLQTWAAHDILVAHATNLLPELQTHLERITTVPASDAFRLANYRTTLAILDTFIELHGTIPAATLARIEKLGYNSQAEELVLLSRLPRDEAQPMLRSFYQPGSSANPAATRVAAQLLAQQPPQGFAAELLNTILITAHIVVHDPNDNTGIGKGTGSADCGGSAPAGSDWPEIGRYAFQDPPGNHRSQPPNQSLFLPAPDPVYLLRSVSRHYYPVVCGGFDSLNDAIRSHLVGTLLHGTPASPFPEHPVDLNIEFQSREAYRARVQAFVDAQQQNFNNVASSLTALNLLTEEERQAAVLHIDLSLQDRRKKPAEDLPVLSFRPPVQWVPAF